MLAELQQIESDRVIGSYARQPVEFVRGEGARLWDAEGNEYLDFLCGISVTSLGHCHPRIVAAVREQAGRLMHTSNLFYTEPSMRLAERLSQSSLGGKVFFCNSGTEANEAALKLARKARRGGGFVVVEGGFHGRTYGSLSATPQEAKQAPFAPLVPGFRAVPPEPEALRAAVDGDTAAVLLEPIQGESGVHVLSPELLAAAREACDEHGAALIFDEIQTGMGRTGTLWAYQASEVVPDAITVAKALGGGMPIGALVTGPRLADVLEPGDHGSTFAGGPVVAGAALAALELTADEKLLARVRELGEELRELLAALAPRHRGPRPRADARLSPVRGGAGAGPPRAARAAPGAERDRPGHRPAAAAADDRGRARARGREEARGGARRLMVRRLAGGFELDDDPARLDVDAIHHFISEISYWGLGRSRERVVETIAGSRRVMGLYRGSEQVGFARAVSDGVTVAYLADVYVLEAHRGLGLGLALVREIVEGEGAPDVHWLLHTADAQGLYERLGFRSGPARYPLMERARPAAAPHAADG